MTPSELAKVREALQSCIHDTTEALAILDREAGRKTRVYWQVQYQDDAGGWVAPKNTDIYPRCLTREMAEAAVANWQVPGRILEVTESWEEPKA